MLVAVVVVAVVAVAVAVAVAVDTVAQLVIPLNSQTKISSWEMNYSDDDENYQRYFL